MNKIKNEILFFFSRKFLFSQLIVIQLTICFTVCMFSICFENTSRTGTAKFEKKYIDTSYYKLSEIFEFDNDDFLSSEESIKKMKLFYNRLKSHEEFRYTESYSNPVSFKNFDGDERFYYGYEQGKIHKENDISSLKAIWFGYNAKDIFELSISDGSWFDEKSFSGSYSSGTTPIVLGHSYSDLYKVGDIIYGTNNIISDTVDHTFEVIGFLENDSTINHNNKIINLNHYIIMPLYDDTRVSLSEDEMKYVRRLYLMKTTGTISTEYSGEYIQHLINNICDETGIHPPYIILGAENQQTLFIHTDMKRCNTLLRVISVMLIVFSCIILTVFEIINIKQNLKYFSVLLISGFRYSDIFKILFGQTMFFQIEAIFFSSCFLVLLCNLFYTIIYPVCFIIIIILAFIITLITDIIAYKKILGFDLTEQLRRR